MNWGVETPANAAACSINALALSGTRNDNRMDLAAAMVSSE
jgi:hypothetical protein